MNAEIDRVFLDTNILLYAHDRSAGHKFEIARKLIEELWRSEQGCLSLQVLQEFCVNVTQKIPKPLERNAAQQIVSDLAHWHVYNPNTDDLIQAIDLQTRYSLSFWDAMVVQSAARMGCQHLISEDLSHGQTYGSVQITNPII
jgi:predicted nucleic acid-binding protein